MDVLLQHGVYFFDAAARSRITSSGSARELDLLNLLSFGQLRDLRAAPATFGEPHPQLLDKLKLLTLASFAADRVGTMVPYAALMAELELPSPAEVEALVVRGVYAGLVEVRGRGARARAGRLPKQRQPPFTRHLPAFHSPLSHTRTHPAFVARAPWISARRCST
jgi:hypothetical protein